MLFYAKSASLHYLSTIKPPRQPAHFLTKKSMVAYFCLIFCYL